MDSFSSLPPGALPGDDSADDAPGFAESLREAIARRGLSLERIRQQMAERGSRVSVATLSYWQSGRSKPERSASLAAIGHLEEILEVSRGHLASHIVPRRGQTVSLGTSEWGEEGPAASLPPYLLSVQRLAASMGIAYPAPVTFISMHDRAQVDANGSDAGRTVRSVIVAEQAGVDRLCVPCVGDGDTESFEVEGVTNCRVVRQERFDDGVGVLAELVLERPLHRGESMLIEHRSTTVRSSPMVRLTRVLGQSVRELVVEVRFPPEAVPVAAQCVIDHDGVPRGVSIDPSGGDLHVLTLDAVPGEYRIDWTW